MGTDKLNSLKIAINNESDLLLGNRNRMCVTDSEDELLKMFYFGVTRFSNLYRLNLQRLRGLEDE